MTRERWQQIETVFHAALACDAGDRAAYLNEACGADDALREEIESLLVHQGEARNFLETPVSYAPVRDQTASRRVVDWLLAKRTLQIALLAPVVMLTFSVIKNRDRTVANLVRNEAAYLYWIAAAGMSLKFRLRIRAWLDRKFPRS
jgi:hypothetical protein